ncbi:MAG: DoxX family protein [Chloroflexi bacterium]|nr:DoxX family protein [Chloroflexota bacterium]
MFTSGSDSRNSVIGSRFIVGSALVLVASSMLKLAHPGPILTYLSSMGFEGTDVYLIAVIELVTAALLLLPRTRALGVLMATAYLGGAVAAHIAIHRFTTDDPFVAFMALHTHIGTLEPGVLLGALWFGVWLSQRPARGLATTQTVPAATGTRPAKTQQTVQPLTGSRHLVTRPAANPVTEIR